MLEVYVIQMGCYGYVVDETNTEYRVEFSSGQVFWFYKWECEVTQ